VLCTRDIYFFLERLQEQGCFVLKRYYKQHFGFFRNFKIKGGRKLLKTYILEMVVPPSPPQLSVSIVDALISAYGFGSSSVFLGSLVSPSVIKLNELSKISFLPVSCLSDKSIAKLNELSNISSAPVSCLSDKSIIKLNELLNTCVGGITCSVEKTITSQ